MAVGTTETERVCCLSVLLTSRTHKGVGKRNKQFNAGFPCKVVGTCARTASDAILLPMSSLAPDAVAKAAYTCTMDMATRSVLSWKEGWVRSAI